VVRGESPMGFSARSLLRYAERGKHNKRLSEISRKGRKGGCPHLLLGRGRGRDVKKTSPRVNWRGGYFVSDETKFEKGVKHTVGVQVLHTVGNRSNATDREERPEIKNSWV